MDITFRENNGILNVHLQGRLDATTASESEKKIKDKISEFSNAIKMIIDLSQLEYISSAGLRVMLVVSKILKANNGKLCLLGLDENVFEIFKISGFDLIFNIACDLDEAVSILND